MRKKIKSNNIPRLVDALRMRPAINSLRIEALRWHISRDEKYLTLCAGQPILHSASANRLLSLAIESCSSFLFSRLGTTESSALACMLSQKVTGSSKPPHGVKYPTHIRQALSALSGVFPPTAEGAANFVSCYVDSLRNVDVLAVRTDFRLEFSFMSQESLIVESLVSEATVLVDFGVTLPINDSSPWTKSLAGKRVLVIHPFARSIERQHSKLEDIFGESGFMPEFDLMCLSPPQTLGESSSKSGFASWVEALESTQGNIESLDFDVALIGAGGYGLPLASFVKSMGKPAIHVGGDLQLLFGILGKRWDDEPAIRNFVNESWVRPQEDEKPLGFRNVEGGCYW